MVNTKVSILELAIITENGSAAITFKNILELARHAEKWGYERFWLAEHHNMKAVASSATSILIGYIANGTKTIRVGSGGIMLPNHAPLVVAEQFGTLATLYPNRIDLGLGRAPGTDQLTAMALRRDRFAAQNFPENVLELQAYLSSENQTSKVRATPGEGLAIPIWILGSSTESAVLAAHLGLPYAFASHFAPAQFEAAIKIYRQHFKPSAQLQQPYVMACVNAIVANEQQTAEKLATSMQQMFIGIIKGESRLLPPPVDNMDMIWTEYEKAAAAQMLTYSFIGDKQHVSTRLKAFIEKFQLDEVMITSHIFDPAARLYSYQLVSEIFKAK